MQLEVCVGNGDPPQLNYLWVGYASVVVAAVDGLVIADVQAGPYREMAKVRSPTSTSWKHFVL